MTTLVLLFSITFMNILASGDKVTINVYSWGEFIADGKEGMINVNEEFTKMTGIKVNYTTFQNNEELYAKLLSKGANYDVIIPSDYMISKLIKNGMLRELNFKNIPNFSKIDKRFVNPVYDPENLYSVPYVWGLVGIFYNKDKVDEPEEKIDWNILWNDKYKGKILMFDNARDAFAISHLRLGQSINTENESEWQKAAEELDKQRPLIQSYVMDQIFDKMGNNEAYIAPYYSGDAVTLMKTNPSLGFVIPKNGTNMFIDAMCIPTNSMYPQEAEAYINFMCNHDIALANVKKTGYSTPLTDVKESLDKSILDNKLFYPDEEVLNKAQVFVDLPENINALIDDLWLCVKIGSKSNPAMLVLVLGIFTIFYISVTLYKKKHN